MAAQPYSIGSDIWNGLSKVMEECNEVGQVGAKIIGVGGNHIHFDGSDLRVRMIEEMGDTLAAIYFFSLMNGITDAELAERMTEKLKLFHIWNTQNRSKA